MGSADRHAHVFSANATVLLDLPNHRAGPARRARARARPAVGPDAVVGAARELALLAATALLSFVQVGLLRRLRRTAAVPD